MKKFVNLSLTIAVGLLTLISAQINALTVNDVANTIKNNKLTVIKFSAPWCGPCNQMAPLFHAVSQEYQHKDVKFLDVNTDAVQGVNKQYNVRSLPTTVFFKDGKELFRETGGLSKPEISRGVARLKASAASSTSTSKPVVKSEPVKVKTTVKAPKKAKVVTTKVVPAPKKACQKTVVKKQPCSC